MAKKKARKAARTVRTRAVRSNRADTTGMEKGDVSLPSSKIDKKWLYIGAAIIVLLAVLYFATSGQLFSGLATLWAE